MHYIGILVCFYLTFYFLIGTLFFSLQGAGKGSIRIGLILSSISATGVVINIKALVSG